jgi:transcription elongation factor GreA
LVLSIVKIKKTKLTDGDEILCAESEADLKTGKISVTSPIRKRIARKSVGDVAEITMPKRYLEI